VGDLYLRVHDFILDNKEWDVMKLHDVSDDGSVEETLKIICLPYWRLIGLGQGDEGDIFQLGCL